METLRIVFITLASVCILYDICKLFSYDTEDVAPYVQNILSWTCAIAWALISNQ